MKLKIDETHPVDIEKTEVLPTISRWNVEMHIYHHIKQIHFILGYNELDVNQNWIFKGDQIFKITDPAEYAQFWQITDGTLNLGKLLRKRMLQTLKAKGWVPTDAEEDTT